MLQLTTHREYGIGGTCVLRKLRLSGILNRSLLVVEDGVHVTAIHDAIGINTTVITTIHGKFLKFESEEDLILFNMALL